MGCSTAAAGEARGRGWTRRSAGRGGWGRAAWALRWAHRGAGGFTEGQRHVTLRGFAPSGPRAAPEAAIGGFLDALGVPPERIPPDPQAQAGLYRSLLARRKMLI